METNITQSKSDTKNSINLYKNITITLSSGIITLKILKHFPANKLTQIFNNISKGYKGGFMIDRYFIGYNTFINIILALGITSVICTILRRNNNVR